MTEKTWQDIANVAQEYRDASINHVEPAIPAVPNSLPLDRTGVPKYLLSTEEVVITQMPPEQLIASLSAGKLTSIAVTTAFLRRAGLAQALVRDLKLFGLPLAYKARPIASPNSSQNEP